MRLRYRADWRTLLWAFALMPAVVALHYVFPRTAGWLLPLAMYGSYSAAVIAHNHNHCPTFTGRWENQPLSAYRRALFRRSRAAWLYVWIQCAVVYVTHVGMCAFAIARFGFGRGVFVYLSALGIPILGALWGIMFTNWVHTVHPRRPDLHWSRLRQEHAKIAHLIAPRLNTDSIFGYALETYLLRRFRRAKGAGVERHAASAPPAASGQPQSATSL